MAIVTPEQYYTNEDLHGNYQYVLLKDIIDSIIFEQQDDDNYIKNVKRSKIIYHAKQAIKNLNRKVTNDVIAIEISVPDSLVAILPQDYVDYIGVDLVVLDETTGSKRLLPLNYNQEINTAIGYLQDNTGELLFDNDGYILTADSNNAYAKPYRSYYYVSKGAQPMIDTSKLSQYGEFVIDKQRGKILFGSEMYGQEVVIKYLSDGLSANLTESQIKVHKDIEQVVKDWVYYACIANKVNVPFNEKDRALRRYKTVLHETKLVMANLDFNEISRVMRSFTMTI